LFYTLGVNLMQPTIEEPIPSSVYKEAGVEKALAAERSIAAIRLVIITFNSLIYYFLIDQSITIPWLAYLIILMSAVYGLTVFLLEPYRHFPVMRSSYFTSISDAEALEISERTVRFHLTNICSKLGVDTRAEAIAWAKRYGLGDAAGK
jgi:hypothetical protein